MFGFSLSGYRNGARKRHALSLSHSLTRHMRKSRFLYGEKRPFGLIRLGKERWSVYFQLEP